MYIIPLLDIFHKHVYNNILYSIAAVVFMTLYCFT